MYIHIYIYIYIYIHIYTSVLLSIPSTMKLCTCAVMLHLKVCPGVLHECVVLAARPGVHLEPSSVNFLVQVTQGTGSCARKVQLAGQGQLIPASTEPNFAVHV